MVPADPIGALVGITTLPNAPSSIVRVFGGTLPRSEVGSMPRTSVVVKAAGGGLLGLEGQVYGDRRVDVDCYGATGHESWNVYLAVEAALESLSHEVWGDALLKWAKPSSRGFQAKDPDTDWDDTVSSWQVLAGKEAAA